MLVSATANFSALFLDMARLAHHFRLSLAAGCHVMAVRTVDDGRLYNMADVVC